MPSCPTCQRAVNEGIAQCPHDGTPIPGITFPHPWIGKVLGERYRVVSKLGEGGMGTVFLAEHVVLGKQLAIKVLREDYSRDEELVRRFQQEAISASQIGHENIVDITDFGRSPEGALYFVMELLQGQSLARVVQREGPLPPARSLPILIQICRALAAAHSRGIIHRDLKPDNVMVLPKDDGNELVKVLDFGISKVSQSQGERITRVGMMMGTPEYMAPEQVDAIAVDHRVDIYALGVLAYEVVTGNVPFEAQTPVKLLWMHQSQAPEPPSKRRPDLRIPARLEAAILRALQKDPAQRQPSMNELANDFAVVARELGVLHHTQTLPSTPAPVRSASNPVIQLVERSTSPAAMHASRGGTMQLSAEELAPPGTLTPPSAVSETLHAVRHTLAPEERAAVRRGSGGLVAALVVLVLALGGGLGYALMQRQSHKDDVQAPNPLTDGVEAPSMLSVGAGRKKPSTPAPPAPVVVPAAAVLHEVHLDSEPSGAEIKLGDQTLGVTPFDLELAEGEAHSYRFELSGYASKDQPIASGDGTVSVKLEKQHRAAHAQSKRPGDDDQFKKIDDLKGNPY